MHSHSLSPSRCPSKHEARALVFLSVIPTNRTRTRLGEHGVGSSMLCQRIAGRTVQEVSADREMSTRCATECKLYQTPLLHVLLQLLTEAQSSD